MGFIEKLKGIANNVEKAVKDYLDEEIRELTTAERNLGKTVFWDTLPFERIRIGNALGYGERPWMQTVDNEGIGTGNLYIVHIGQIGYPDATSPAQIPGIGKVRETFIHELTHVWQASHGVWVLTKAAPYQIYAETTGNDVYSYQVGEEWNSYNVEQQGNIVEHWFANGMSTQDDRYQYIRDNIRNCGGDNSRLFCRR